MTDAAASQPTSEHWADEALATLGLGLDDWVIDYQARKEASAVLDLPKVNDLPADVADTLRLARECLLTQSGTPWPVSATTILHRIDAALASLRANAEQHPS